MFIFGNAAFLKRTKSCQNATSGDKELVLSVSLVRAAQHRRRNARTDAVLTTFSVCSAVLGVIPGSGHSPRSGCHTSPLTPPRGGRCTRLCCDQSRTRKTDFSAVSAQIKSEQGPIASSGLSRTRSLKLFLSFSCALPVLNRTGLDTETCQRLGR